MIVGHIAFCKDQRRWESILRVGERIWSSLGNPASVCIGVLYTDKREREREPARARAREGEGQGEGGCACPFHFPSSLYYPYITPILPQYNPIIPVVSIFFWQPKLRYRHPWVHGRFSLRLDGVNLAPPRDSAATLKPNPLKP